MTLLVVWSRRTDGRGNCTSFTYDLNGRLDSEIAMQEALAPNSGASLIRITATRDFITFAQAGGDVVISRNRKHEAVVIQGIVVDNVNPGGIPIEEWLQRLGVGNLSGVEIRPLSDG